MTYKSGTCGKALGNAHAHPPPCHAPAFPSQLQTSRNSELVRPLAAALVAAAAASRVLALALPLAAAAPVLAASTAAAPVAGTAAVVAAAAAIPATAALGPLPGQQLEGGKGQQRLLVLVCAATARGPNRRGWAPVGGRAMGGRPLRSRWCRQRSPLPWRTHGLVLGLLSVAAACKPHHSSHRACASCSCCRCWAL